MTSKITVKKTLHAEVKLVDFLAQNAKFDPGFPDYLSA